MFSVADILTEEEKQKVLPEDLASAFSFISITYEDLFARVKLDYARAKEYLLFTYDKDDKLIYVFDIALSLNQEPPILGLALEFPYKFDLRDDVDIEKFRDEFSKLERPSRRASVEVYNKIMSK